MAKYQRDGLKRRGNTPNEADWWERIISLKQIRHAFVLEVMEKTKRKSLCIEDIPLHKFKE
ncbi:site-specific integrase [Sesbania bispinosa]|nr:site-specific integrase [Sesbania bispinosa]